MLKTRIVTAAVSLPAVLWILWHAQPAVVAVLLMTLSGLATYELARMLYPAFCRKIYGSDLAAPDRDLRIWPAICALSSMLMFVICVFVDLAASERGGIIFSTSAAILMGTFSGRDINHAMIRSVVNVYALAYGCLPWMTMFDIYQRGGKPRFLFLLMAIVMAGDSGAYFFGRRYGRHPLAPRLSPKKSWEGLLAGVACSVVAAWVLNLVFRGKLGPSWFMVAVAISVSLMGVIGDLVESAVKRFADVKDSGTLLPGHGGVLDRADAFLLAAPLMWLLLHLFDTYA